jgi:hypothetical protein
MRKLALIAAGLLVAGIAVAQFPALLIASPIGTETINVVNAGPQIVSVYLTQLRDASGYVKLVPTTGQTYTPSSNISVIQATPAGSLSAWTVKTPASPVDGQRLRIFSTAAVSTFALTASGTQTVDGGVTSLSANVGVEYIYSASNTTWDRIL